MIWALMERRTRSGKITTMAGLFPQSTDSRRQGHHMDERVPGAAVMPGFNEEFIRTHGEYHFDEKMIADTGRIARMNPTKIQPMPSPHESYVDSEEEHRVIREELHQAQALREELGRAVVHTATATIEGRLVCGRADHPTMWA
jgi:hypothetical protein